jgi:nicotinamidase/pyrazinamidase
MLRGPLVFVDIDTQRDFLEQTGSLAIEGGGEIIPSLARLTRFAQQHQIPILATACAHRLDDPDPEPFPPHCLIGTTGQTRVDATTVDESLIIPRDGSFEGDELPLHLTIEKRHYDAYTHPEMSRLVELYNHRKPTFVLYGVATDYCVNANAQRLLERGCKVAIVVDAIRAVELSIEAAILTDLVSRGATLTLTDIVCDE